MTFDLHCDDTTLLPITRVLVLGVEELVGNDMGWDEENVSRTPGTAIAPAIDDRRIGLPVVGRVVVGPPKK